MNLMELYWFCATLFVSGLLLWITMLHDEKLKFLKDKNLTTDFQVWLQDYKKR